MSYFLIFWSMTDFHWRMLRSYTWVSRVMAFEGSDSVSLVLY